MYAAVWCSQNSINFLSVSTISVFPVPCSSEDFVSRGYITENKFVLLSTLEILGRLMTRVRNSGGSDDRNGQDKSVVGTTPLETVPKAKGKTTRILKESRRTVRLLTT